MENWKQDIINNYRDEQFQQGVEVTGIQCMPYKYGLPNKNKQDIYFLKQNQVWNTINYFEQMSCLVILIPLTSVKRLSTLIVLFTLNFNQIGCSTVLDKTKNV